MANQHYEYSGRVVSARNLRLFCDRLIRDIDQIMPRIPERNTDARIGLSHARNLLLRAKDMVINKHVDCKDSGRSYHRVDPRFRPK